MYDLDIDRILAGVDIGAIERSLGEFPDLGGNIPAPFEPGIFSKLLGIGRQGENASPSLVNPDMLRRLEKQSLLAAGLGLMSAAHTRGQNNFGAGGLAALKAGHETFGSGLESLEKQAILSRDVAEKEKLDALRERVAKKYPEPKGEKPAERIIRLTNMAVEYAQGGDHETAQKMVATANALRLAGGGKPFSYIQNADGIFKINNATGEMEKVRPNEIQQARLELYGLSQLTARERLDLARELSKKPSEGERDTRLLFDIANSVQPKINAAKAPSRWAWAAREIRKGVFKMVPIVGEVLTPAERQFYAAANSFMDAYVRETSGAATNADELTRAWQTYIPAPGDDPGTLAYKRRLREVFLEAMNRKALRAGMSGYTPPAAEDGSDEDNGADNPLDPF